MSRALRGEVWDVEFRPAVGAEIQKTQIPDTVGTQPDGTLARNFAPQSGRVVVVGTNALLEAFMGADGQPALVLYGPSGANYVLEATSDLSKPPPWQAVWEGTLTDLFRLIEPAPGTGQVLFYRARRE